MPDRYERRTLYHIAGETKDIFSTISIRDPQAAALVQVIDTALDRQWFYDHPKAASRVRQVSQREAAAFGLSPDARIEITKCGPYDAILATRVIDLGTTRRNEQN